MIIGVAVDKQTSWRGIQETFTNVWHFDTAVEVTSQQVADAVVDKEKGLMAGNVNFKRVQVWGPTDGTKAQNQMLLQQNLTGSGSAAASTVTAKELTAVVSWDTGRLNTRGAKIYLRKYLHLGGLPEAAEEAAKGNGPLSVAEKTRLVNFGNSMKNVVGVSGASICDKKGRKLPVNTPAVALPHLHTRQFRR
jgi:hypothetical protein